MSGLKNALRYAVDYIRLSIKGPAPDPVEAMADISAEDRAVIRDVRAFTMTSPERLAALCEAVRYVEKGAIPGAFVECGVWRGGSMMAVAKTLVALGKTDRDLFLFDTFEGMTAPDERDVSITGQTASALSQQHEMSESDLFWCYAPLEAVKKSLLSTGYPGNRIHFVKGSVEETIPAGAPEQIALLRLDTDWYQSTHHELVHLFPRLQRSGVLIIDDYGHWQGARKAVDEYFIENKIDILLSRIDYTGRMAVKIS